MTLTQTAIVTVITRQNSNSSITFSEQSETSKKVTNRRQNQYLKLTEMYTCQFDTIQPKSMLTFNLWFWPFERTDLSWVMSFLPTKKVRCSSWSFNILEKKIYVFLENIILTDWVKDFCRQFYKMISHYTAIHTNIF